MAEYLAGYFYQRTRKLCRSAIPRYEGIVADFPDFEEMDEVLYRLGECLIEQRRGAEALPHLQRLIDDFPASSRVPAARQLMVGAGQGAPSPSPTPASSQSAP
jgi:outer membrane protein assembly factor BamD (BamD/ComL family)